MTQHTKADQIPVAHTPAGGWGDEMPPEILAGCTEPLVEGAPDLRGLWKVVEVAVGGETVHAHPALGHVERIEQCGDRLIVVASGVIHDMRCDATIEHGVHDVMQTDFTTRIDVVASFENEVHVLRPVGLEAFEVTRRLVGSQMEWSYAGAFVARLDRVAESDRPSARS
ncbi:MAG TPA: hypothetical protein VED63_11750 [Acidimicrobiales bacterium]|nr:hypothetical protein [Acidimicrobiales bacterium]